MNRRALEGIRILDFSQIWAGPYCGRLLADMGAQIIKIESAGRYDSTRDSGFGAPGVTGPPRWNIGSWFYTRNRNKLGVTIDMTTVEGKSLFLKLLQISDVVLENFSARVMGNWGIDYPVLQKHKTDIIMISMPASGMTGPERDYVGMGANISPLAGLVAITGYKYDVPHSVGAYTDPISGLTGAGALLAALHYRARTGKGQYIDLSQREAAARFIGDIILDYTMNGRLRPVMGNRHPAWAPQGCYRCQGEDAWVALSVTSDAQWQALCRVMDHAEWQTDPRFVDIISRYAHHDELDELLTEWTQVHDQRNVMEMLQAVGVPAGAVLSTAQMFEDPQFAARGYFPEVTHPEAGTFPVLGVFAKLSKTPGGVVRPAPLLGEHNEYVFQTILGMSREEFNELTAAGIIANNPSAAAG